jgi:outer membrane receptor protein involved in Fe transport
LPVISTVRVATGSRQTLHALPVAAAALDRAAIASSAALTSDALLRTLPGFDRSRSNSMFTNYGQLRISFAGAGTDRGLMLADAVPAQDGFGGQVDWAAYPSSALQRAELLLGAGSALYGSGAVGGVLDVQTYAPPVGTAYPSGTISFAGGTRGYSQQWTNAGASITPRLGASVSLQQQRLQYWALPPAYSSPIDRISQADASMAQVRLRYAAGPRDTLELGQLGAWDDQFEGRQNYTFSRRLSQSALHYTHAALRSSLQAMLFARSTFVLNAADQFPAKPGVLRYVQSVPVSESGASVMWDTGDLPFLLQIRADARQVRGENDQSGAHGVLQSSGSGSQQFGGVAAQGTWRQGAFEALAGARFDTITSYDQQISGKAEPNVSTAAVSPRVALRYSLSPQVALRASSGAGFRPPFLNELVRGFFIGNVSYQPNPLLVPERSVTNSAGVDVISARGRLAIDAFDTRVNDAILFRTLDPTHQQRSNIGQTRTDGFTASYTHSLGTCSRLSAWVSDQNARITAGPPNDVGKRLPYVPAQSGSLDYTGQIGRTAVGLSVSYIGQTYADDLNLQPLGSAVIVGTTVRLPLAGGASLDLSAQNLTDARYLSSVDRYGPPSVISLGVSLPIGPSQDTHTSACLP